jgi:hypothetical protein
MSALAPLFRLSGLMSQYFSEMELKIETGATMLVYAIVPCTELIPNLMIRFI